MSLSRTETAAAAADSTSPAFDATLADALGALHTAFDVRRVAECGSTNSELMDAPPATGGRVAVLVADRQTAGRGRRGRQWQSWAGGSLTFSARWCFAAGAPVPAGLSLVAGLALARAFETLGVAGLQLKWPNDVLVHGHKLAGILVELQPGRDRSLAAVIGIGINLCLPADAHIPGQAGVTDLARELGAPPERAAVLGIVLRELHALLELYATAGFGALRGAWQQRNAFAELPVRISGEGTELTGTCAGVDEDGALLLRTEAGLQRILSGEVSLRALP